MGNTGVQLRVIAILFKSIKFKSNECVVKFINFDFKHKIHIIDTRWFFQKKRDSSVLIDRSNGYMKIIKIN